MEGSRVGDCPLFYWRCTRPEGGILGKLDGFCGHSLGQVTSGDPYGVLFAHAEFEGPARRPCRDEQSAVERADLELRKALG